MAITIEVAYALPARQFVQTLVCDPPLSLADAIELSGIRQQCPHIRIEAGLVGVDGYKRPLHYQLESSARVEIYRPLHLSPTEARRRRARKKSR